MENNNNLKSLYLALFVLTLINAVFSTLFITFSLGAFLDIAIFIIIIVVLHPKLSKTVPMPFGLKLLLISCIIHFTAVIIFTVSTILNNIIAYEIGRRYSNRLFIPLNLLGISLAIASIVLLIISCVKVYKEYGAIN